MDQDLSDCFARRHIGPTPEETRDMLRVIGAGTLDELIDEIVPADIRRSDPLPGAAAESEAAYLDHLRGVAARNRRYTSCIGLGYFECVTPPVILRNVLENPSWYTPYTPYQAEIAQGRLEALLNFQTVVSDLTAMDIANASLLDEASAAAEAMTMLHRIHHRTSRRSPRSGFLVSSTVFPQTIDVLRGRAEPLGIDVSIEDPDRLRPDDSAFGMLLQTPDANGTVWDLEDVIRSAQAADVRVAVATDLLSLTLLRPPGEVGADVVLGSTQRFGVPMMYGGPHAAFFAARKDVVREMPGRIIGISVDAHGNPAYRMALQTREQHIRREKAKSNICTAQALLANVAGFYAVYHGPAGLRAIAKRIHGLAGRLHRALSRAGFSLRPGPFFDTIQVLVPDADALRRIRDRALARGVNFRYGDNFIGVSLGESTRATDISEFVSIFGRRDDGTSAKALDPDDAAAEIALPDALRRRTAFLTSPVFHEHQSETAMMRYIKSLERKDIGLDVSMIPLGSCTMKLNAAVEMIPVTWPDFCDLHPFAPEDQAEGYRVVREGLETALCTITGLDAVSLQPNSGAQGEYAGLLVIRAYHRDRGDVQRDVVLIPSSAHGTNPASAVMAGMNVEVVPCDGQGNIDVEQLGARVDALGDRIAALMVTYPSTHGVFEEGIRAMCDRVHASGGQVYMDGANMNAQVGLTSPAAIGADVCHLNLHKTFGIPHGGGGPGVGPIAVARHLAPYLPGHPLAKTGGARPLRAITAAPWGSAGILVIPYGYIRLLGGEGMTACTKAAILNANYIKARLERHFDVLYTGASGRVAHELIFDLRGFHAQCGITETDVAKRLMDYGFHAPTVSWPVPGTMMIEPTESEPRAELDRFCDALIAIRGEIQAVINGEADREDNVLKNAPHTADHVASDDWPHPYSRERAAYPLPFVRRHKFWPAVGRIDNLHGDRHLACSCPGMTAYTDTAEVPSPGIGSP